MKSYSDIKPWLKKPAKILPNSLTKQCRVPDATVKANYNSWNKDWVIKITALFTGTLGLSTANHITSSFSFWYSFQQGKEIFCSCENIFTCGLKQTTRLHNFINLNKQNKSTTLRPVRFRQKLPIGSKNIGHLILFSNGEWFPNKKNTSGNKIH